MTGKSTFLPTAPIGLCLKQHYCEVQALRNQTAMAPLVLCSTMGGFRQPAYHLSARSLAVHTTATKQTLLSISLSTRWWNNHERQRRSYSSAPPTIDRSASKLYGSAHDAVADIQSGSTVLSSGFGLCGVAETIIQAIRDRGAGSLHSLTAVSNNAGIEGVGGLSLITKTGQVSKLILSFLGNNKALEKKYLSGNITIELCPQGTLAERIRAGGVGVPAFYTPTAVNTLLQDGKIPARFDGNGNVSEYGTPRETRVFDGRTYLMETALTGDVAILRAWKADEAGNCVFRYIICTEQSTMVS
jgi:3-oxoacid CoA-transferase